MTDRWRQWSEDRRGPLLLPAKKLGYDITLVVVMKRPRLGHGKQRLAATLGAEPACQLAEGFLACALEDAHAWPGPVVLAPASADDVGWAAQLLPAAQVMAQSAGNLGERLQQLDRRLRAQGADQLLFMGTDAPALRRAHYAAAIHQLTLTDVALSRARDGGVTLMGNRRPWPDLSTLPWSTERLADALAQVCQEAGLTAGDSLAGYDIDFETDLVRLQADLQRDSRPARCQLLQLMQALPIRPASSVTTGVPA